MSDKPSTNPAKPPPQGAADNPAQDDADTYADSTEGKLDHSKPPTHSGSASTAVGKKHPDAPQISVGKP